MKFLATTLCVFLFVTSAFAGRGDGNGRRGNRGNQGQGRRADTRKPNRVQKPSRAQTTTRRDTRKPNRVQNPTRRYNDHRRYRPGYRYPSYPFYVSRQCTAKRVVGRYNQVAQVYYGYASGYTNYGLSVSQRACDDAVRKCQNDITFYNKPGYCTRYY